MKPAVRQLLLSPQWWKARPLSFGCLGDSITRNQYTPSTAWSAQVGTVLIWGGRAWGLWACQLLGRKAWADINAFEGYSGFRTDEILNGMLPIGSTFTIGPVGATATIPNGVLSCRPDYCFVMAGTNDLSQSVAVGTAVANLRAIWAKLRGNGTEPIAISLLPRDAPASFAASVPTWNAAIQSAAASDNVLFVDVYTNCNNGAGGFKANWTFVNNAADPTGLHPGNEACHQMATDIAAAISSRLIAKAGTPYLLNDAGCVITNGAKAREIVLHSNLGGGLFPNATGWGARLETGGTSTVSVASASPAELGNALRIVNPTPGAGADLYSDRNGPAAYAVNPGRVYGFFCRLKFTATHAQDVFTLGIQSPSVAATLWTLQNTSTSASTAAGASFTARDVYHEFQIPPGMTTIRPWLAATAKLGGAGCTLEVAQMGIREIG